MMLKKEIEKKATKTIDRIPGTPRGTGDLSKKQ